MAVVANTAHLLKLHAKPSYQALQTVTGTSITNSAFIPGNPLPGYKGSLIVSTIGEGGFGDVKLIKLKNGDSFAVKILPKKTLRQYGITTKNEVQLHGQLEHERVVKFIRHFSMLDYEFICTEYVTGGDLFERIQSQDGLGESESLRIFRQLMEGVNYIHNEGIVHRDIKPENVLIDNADNIKITDFGLAERYRVRGQVRMLCYQCGTPGYAAPEVLSEGTSERSASSWPEYHATPVDIWSCGIVLIMMISGDLPWETTTESCYEFTAFFRHDVPMQYPLTEIGPLPTVLLEGMLTLDPLQRSTAEDVLKSAWFKKRKSARPRGRPSSKHSRR